jgi:hypothetical protein
MLRRMFRPKKDELNEQFTILHNAEFRQHRRLTWKGRMHTEFWCRSVLGKVNLKNFERSGRIILKLKVEIWAVRMRGGQN